MYTQTNQFLQIIVIYKVQHINMPNTKNSIIFKNLHLSTLYKIMLEELL